jgi:chemotaxis-related protein WspB
MLVIMCHAGENRYAIDSADVIEVVPLVNYDTLADAPNWLAGVFAHRGVATPLVDFTLLLTGRPCPRRWNSRVLLVHSETEDIPKKIGVLAERVSTAEIDEPAVPMVPSPTMEALGPILLDGRGMFHLVDFSRLLSRERRDLMQPVLEKGNA